MNKKIWLMLILSYTIVNFLLFQIMNENLSLLIILIRILLFSITGIFTALYVFKINKSVINSTGNSSSFVIKMFVLIFLLVLYYYYSMDQHVWQIYDNIYQFFFELNIEDAGKYPLIVMYIYDSFIDSFALISYIASYLSYSLTLFILKKKDGEIAE